MLRDRREPLVEEVFEAPVVRANRECPPPQVRAPVSDSFDEADQLALVRWQFGVLWGQRSAEESQRPIALVKDGTEAGAGGVAVDEETLGEVRELEHRG